MPCTLLDFFAQIGGGKFRTKRSKRETRSLTPDIRGEQSVFPLVASGPVENEQGSGWKRDANAGLLSRIRRIRGNFAAGTIAIEGHDRVAFQREVEDDFSVRKRVIEMEVEIRRFFRSVAKNEDIGRFESDES